MSRAGIELDDVTKRYGKDVVAVRSLSLRVEPGEVFALLGPSGCGKTTTLRLIAGFERPDSGAVAIGGLVVDNGAEVRVDPEDRGVGFVFQDYALFPHLTVASNIAFGLRTRADAKRARVEGVLGLCALDGLHERFPHELSGGQQQRVAVARALAPDFPVVLLDEPLSNLDVGLRASLRADLARILRASGRTVLLVTHDREEAFEMSDRVGVMVRGSLRQVGTPEEIHRYPVSREVAELLGEGSFLPGRVEKNGVSTELGLLRVDTNARTGDAVVVLLREDAIDLVPDERGIGVVEARAFRGADYALRIRLASGIELRCRHPSTDLTVGRRIQPRFRDGADRGACVYPAVPSR